MRIAVGAGLVTALLFVASPTRAETDGGDYSSLLRFSADGARLLLGTCDMNEDDGVLEVRTEQGAVLEQLPFTHDPGRVGPSVSCSPDVFERAVVSGDFEALVALLKKHGLEQRPRRSGLSGDLTRYVGVEDDQDARITLFLYDAEGYRKLKYAPVLLNDLGTNAYAVTVSWAPKDRYAIVTGSRAVSEEAGERRWEPVMLRVSQPSRRPDIPVDRASLAKKLNGFGYKAYKKGDYLKATERYSEAVMLDPDYETAIYNLACMKALNGSKTEALEGLRKLRRMDTPLAREKLGKAPRDPDFRSIRKDSDFIGLTGRP